MGTEEEEARMDKVIEMVRSFDGFVKKRDQRR